ncbi:gp58 [Mycobacterium phage PLot]|uniref:Uncharacterized protein n=17 Tax=Plotvirus TaxID=2169613 RepID=Q19Y91_9CAUD|nr:gp58 [Mycobacterium phage Troll4]YP_655251.1 gp55 [Mycobacterium phage PBI1]YP_655437.1 gp58 [Mycobacterium phage PLot]ACD49642.1 hypothetical protein Adjutor_57 [Mycobacterium phage Adjutor]ACI06345.1 hypothetical protein BUTTERSCOTCH_57 [Mycobacterium phage Butterscotch]AEK10269.1 hypothetical protein PBI_SIRHARLEY_60 [Mycobacterium phage SirHarley]AER49810.1 hypothetical protein NOVA_57 [Mycobacterium phage Nova]AVP43154.1 hypothetical protein PBI_BIGMAMA_56 [Mycobacterium phage BigMam
MAGSLKDMGLKEVAALKKRVNRQYALNRINGGDRDNLIELINKVEAYIIKMPEGKRSIPDFY